MSILRRFRTFRLALWGTLFLLPVSLVIADSPQSRPNGQPRLPFLRRYAKPDPAGTTVERAPASVSRKRPAPTVKTTKKPGTARGGAHAARPAPAPRGRVPAGRRAPAPRGVRGRTVAPNARGRPVVPSRARGTPTRAPSASAAPVRRAIPAMTPVTRGPAQVAPAAPPGPPPPYASSPKTAPGAPVKNIQLRDPNDKSDGSRSIKLDMTRPYLR